MTKNKTTKASAKKTRNQLTMRSGQTTSTRGALTAPASIGFTMPRTKHKLTDLGNGKLRVAGSEMLGGTSGAAVSTGVARAIFELNPACWGNSRLQVISRTYEKYRFNRIRITYMPRTGTNFVGSVALVVETDPTEPFPTAVASDAPKLFSNAQFSAMGPVWAPLSVDYKREPDDMKLYFASATNADTVRDTSQAKVMLWSDGPDTNIGYVWVDYEIDFYYPELEMASSFGTQYAYGTPNASMVASVGAPLMLDFVPSGLSISADGVYEIVTTSNKSGVWTTLAIGASAALFGWTAGRVLYGAYLTVAGSGSGLVLFQTLSAAIQASIDNAITNSSGAASILATAEPVWIRTVRSRA